MFRSNFSNVSFELLVFSLCQALRTTSAQTKHIPTVFSTHASAKEEQESKGAEAYSVRVDTRVRGGQEL